MYILILKKERQNAMDGNENFMLKMARRFRRCGNACFERQADFPRHMIETAKAAFNPLHARIFRGQTVTGPLPASRQVSA
jgi:hypothetical protein